MPCGADRNRGFYVLIRHTFVWGGKGTPTSTTQMEKKPNIQYGAALGQDSHQQRGPVLQAAWFKGGSECATESKTPSTREEEEGVGERAIQHKLVGWQGISGTPTHVPSPTTTRTKV